MSIIERFQNGWDAFIHNKDPATYAKYREDGEGSYYRPDAFRYIGGFDRSIASSICTKIAVDAASMKFKHCLVDETGSYIADVNDSLNDCFTLSANIDQTPQELIQDAVHTMLEDGACAMVPVKTDVDPLLTDSYNVEEIRVGKVVEWRPTTVRVDLYDERTGRHQEIVLPKRIVALPKNPFYAIMNEPNSSLQRLKRKIALLDEADEKNAAGKIDLIVQLPYSLKTEEQKREAEKRRASIERQLNGSRYGVAYTDATEKITQLNRSLENNLLNQIESLQNDYMSRMGMTVEILNGTAEEGVMVNYYSRIVEAVLTAIVTECRRTWFTKNAISKGHTIMYFRDPFKLVPVGSIATIADTFTRNEIMTKNEVRTKIGMMPADDPKADMLINSNLNHTDEEIASDEQAVVDQKVAEEEIQNGQ